MYILILFIFFSSTRLQRLLTCFDNFKNIAIGERYGYLAYEQNGYNYITGGGGIVFSAPLVHQLATSAICECPSDQSPDDMFLGVCLTRLGVPVIHSSAFHQVKFM